MALSIRYYDNSQSFGMQGHAGFTWEFPKIRGPTDPKWEGSCYKDTHIISSPFLIEPAICFTEATAAVRALAPAASSFVAPVISDRGMWFMHQPCTDSVGGALARRLPMNSP